MNKSVGKEFRTVSNIWTKKVKKIVKDILDVDLEIIHKGDRNQYVYELHMRFAHNEKYKVLDVGYDVFRDYLRFGVFVPEYEKGEKIYQRYSWSYRKRRIPDIFYETLKLLRKIRDLFYGELEKHREVDDFDELTDKIVEVFKSQISDFNHMSKELWGMMLL